MVAAFFAPDDIDATARRTGFVQRTATLPGTLCRALMTCGAWREAPPTLAQLAAKVSHWSQPVDLSPAAIQQRLNQNALAWLQDLSCQALAQLHALAPGCAEGLVPSFTKVDRAESPGGALPAARHKTVPGAGGRAAQAGATRQAVWDETRSRFGHLALPPWHIADQRARDEGVA